MSGFDDPVSSLFPSLISNSYLHTKSICNPT